MQNTRAQGYSVLIVDDKEGLRYGLKRLFKRQGFTAYAAADFGQAVEVIATHPIDIALVDIRLKGGKSGIDLLKECKRIEPDILTIMMTGYGSVDTAVTSIKAGASDYILKPIDNQKLIELIFKNLELRSLKSENTFLKNELLNQALSHQCISANPDIQTLFRKADKIKDNPVTVLITGESGTGKEVLARYVHFTSNRQDANFVSVNCAALSESLLLSELFGHEKGAFTGAIGRKIGKFEIADRGTLFLDEIGDMSLDIQAKLLRVIEESSFERLGGTRQIQVNLRLIAATNKNLEKAIKTGTFREDLYYRINVVRLHLPPLRQRKDDIPLLIAHFIQKYNRKYHKRVRTFNEGALHVLTAYNWPGNVRELENVVNHAVLLSEGKIIEVEDLKANVFSGSVEHSLNIDVSKITSLKATIEDIVTRYEKHIIQQFLSRNDYNKSKTARELAITRRTLAQKIEKYNL